jgi:hypothetical protein
MGQDFSLAASGQTSATVAPGQAASYKVSVAPGGGFSHSVTLSCSGGPVKSSCSVSPGSIALSGTSAVTATVTVTNPGSSAGLTQPVGGAPPNNLVGLWAAFTGTLGLALLTGMTRYRRAWQSRLCYGLTLICLLSVGIIMTACGGGSSSSTGGGTQAGTYTVTVTGNYTSGSTTLTHDTKLTLVVQ